MSQDQKTVAKRNYTLPIAIMFALFFMIAFVTGYQNPLGEVIKEMTGGNVVLSQLGTLANFIAYAFMGYPAGKLLEAKGYRFTALWAVTVGFIGVLITYLSGLLPVDQTTAVIIYLIGAFVAGFSMCMLNTVVNPMLNSLGRDQKQGNQLVQFGGTCNSLGATLAPVIVCGLIGGAASTISSANPVFYMAMGIFAVAFIVIFFSKLPESPDMGKKKAGEQPRVADALKYPHLVWGLVAIFCYVGIEVGIANWTLQYLTGSAEAISANNPGIGTDPKVVATTIAGTIVGMYWLFMLIGRLCGGIIGGKVSSRAMLIATSVGAIILTVVGINIGNDYLPFIGFDSSTLSFGTFNVPTSAILFVCCGLCTSVMWGAIFNLAVEGLGKYTAIASGLFMAMVCGGGILPALQGLIAKTSVLSSFWLIAGLTAYLLLYALVLSKPRKA